jgi:hypothetical protein
MEVPEPEKPTRLCSGGAALSALSSQVLLIYVARDMPRAIDALQVRDQLFLPLQFDLLTHPQALRYISLN